MSSRAFGIEALRPNAATHYLGFASARSAGDNLFELWNGSTDAAKVAELEAEGRWRVGDGTAALPSLGFKDDTNTGLFRPAADIIAWATGGTERFRLNDGGNFAIGRETIESWSSGVRAFQLGQRGAIAFDTSNVQKGLYLTTNAYNDASTNWKRPEDAGQSCMVSLELNGIFMKTAANTGVADSDITWVEVLRVANDGNLRLSNLPTSDPSVSGALWNDSGTVKVSAG